MADAPAPESPFDVDLRFDAVDLVGRTGSHRHVERTVAAPPRETEEAGGLAMQVPEGEDITVEAELESVVEGIYAHGTVTAELAGECSRCLDPVTQDIAARIDELFMFPSKVKADEREDATLMDEDDYVNLGPLVRDVLATEADERPLCRPDCPGLCSHCGFRMEDDPDHHHVVYDDRFAALQVLLDDADDSQGTAGSGRKAD